MFGSKHLRLFTAYYHHHGEEQFRVATHISLPLVLDDLQNKVISCEVV